MGNFNIKLFWQVMMTVLLFSFSITSYGQRIIQGKVTDEQGEALIGATVVIEGSTNGSITDLNGMYSLSVEDGSYTVRASYVGFKTQTKDVVIKSGNQTVNFTLLFGTDLSEIVVIGSRNQNRTAIETAVPVDIISMTNIVDNAPQIEVADILNYLAPSFSANKQTISDGTDHVDPASLRGLGVDHVLVLINGKRRHTSSLVNVNGTVGRGSVGTDLNAIPAAAIDRIEILRDGAAAQYGSDAIAGVINIVLKSDADKVYFSSTVGEQAEGDGDRTQFNVNYGFKVGEKGFLNMTGQYQYRGRTDRAGEWTGSVFKTNGSGIFAEDFAEDDFSPFDVGRRLTATEAAAINSANSVTNNLTESEEEALINQNGGRRAFTMKVGQSQAINTGLMLNSAYDLANEGQLYLFGGINFRRGLATGFYRLPNQSRTLTTVYPNGFLPEINTRIFDGSIAGGIRGKVGEWDVDFSNTFGKNSFNYVITNTHNASRGTSSPTSFDAGGFALSQNTTNLDFTRYFDDALNGVNIAFGAVYRIENYTVIAGEEGSYRNYGNVNTIDTLADGTAFSNEFNQTNIFYGRPGGSQVFPGFQPDNELSRSRGNLGLYWDTEFQFTNKFFVDVAARFEDYTDFGSTFNWKVASRYELTGSLAIRGAVSTGFRAPSLQQRYFNSTSTLFQIDPETGENVPNEVGTFSNDSKVANLFGIPSLTDEESFNVSAGLTATFLDAFNLTIDGYFIKIDDRVVLTNSFSAANSSEIAAILERANAGRATFFVNGIDTETSGVDIILSHETTIGSSKLNSSIAANFTQTEVTNVNIPANLSGAPDRFFNREERNRFEDALPQSKINLTFDYKLNKFISTLRFVRFGEVYARTGIDSDESTWIDQKFEPKIITDLNVGYNFTNDLKLTLGANNLFDVYPDENREEFRSSERFIYSRRVSQFGFNGAYYFGRLTLKF
ncbi:MAG: TonB-dependent receptor [Ekhidna sp.]|nr:TonB-dependent receptor [Ekhidna sp.]